MTSSFTGLIGFPVSHSLSPVIHGYWIEKYAVEGEYKLLTTPPARLRQTITRMRNKNIVGLNVTVPHKEAVVEYLDDVDVTAEHIGAVNTIINRGGQFIGTNTDAYGFIENLKSNFEVARKLRGHVFVLGAGGATRAAIVALKNQGAGRITVCNRTAEKAALLAKEFEIEVCPWDERSAALAEVDLLVNTTSLGMEGQPPLEIDLALLPEGAAVHDIVYAPLETPLLAAARARGLLTIDGLGMLLYQAQAAFEAWHGIRPVVDASLRALVLSAREAGEATEALEN